jgi:hypothetical protein
MHKIEAGIEGCAEVIGPCNGATDLGCKKACENRGHPNYACIDEVKSFKCCCKN